MKRNSFEINFSDDPMRAYIKLNGELLTDVIRVSFDLNTESRVVMKLEIYGEAIINGSFAEEELIKINIPSDKGQLK